jgi:hypothetical protein
MCHPVWLFIRKYGTVWYHPACSKLWYLTLLSFVNFQEKLTGTSSLLFARVKPACSACCVFGARCTFCVNNCVVAHRSDRCSSPVRPVPTGQTHQSDRSGTATAPSSVLRSWLCGSIKEPSGFLVNHWKPRELGVASATDHS